VAYVQALAIAKAQGLGLCAPRPAPPSLLLPLPMSLLYTPSVDNRPLRARRQPLFPPPPSY